MSTESLTTRVKRIISGSAHALVSAIEELAPEAVMEEAIREIDGAIDDVRSELGRLIAAKHLASKRLMEENSRHETLSEQIGVAVDQGREDLAKAAISKQLDIEAQVPILEATIAESAGTEKEMEGYLTALQAKRREMQDELLHFQKLRRAAAQGAIESGISQASTVQTRVSRAETAFDRVLQRQLGVPGLRGVGDAKTASQLSELESLSRTNRVEERLAQVLAERSAK